MTLFVGAIAIKLASWVLLVTALMLIGKSSAYGRDQWKITITENEPHRKEVVLYAVGEDDIGEEFVRRLVKARGEALTRIKLDNLYGPDSGFVEVAIKSPGGSWVLRSWHPLIEKNAKLVATKKGIEALNGRTRSSVLEQQPPDYKEFRSQFDSLMAEVESFAKSKARSR